MKKLKRINNKTKFIIGSGLLALSSSVFAIDVSSVVTSITTDGTSAITAIGMAMLTLASVAIVFKWAKAAIFG